MDIKKGREPESQRADVMYSGHQRFSLPVPDKENRCDMYTMMSGLQKKL